MNNKGFSLIEVLVTVGLVGILVGIAVPSYNGYKKNTVEMALKADLGNGSKVYNAKYAVESTYCFSFEEVGLPVDKKNNSIYKKKGWFGFSSVNTDCSVDPDTVKWVQDGKECYNSSNKQWSTPSINATTMASECTGTAGTLKDRRGLEFSGTAPSDCELASNSFLMGATTNTSSVEKFYYANDEGAIKTADGTTNKCVK